jgi:hypothetical protein
LRAPGAAVNAASRGSRDPAAAPGENPALDAPNARILDAVGSNGATGSSARPPLGDPRRA